VAVLAEPDAPARRCPRDPRCPREPWCGGRQPARSAGKDRNPSLNPPFPPVPHSAPVPARPPATTSGTSPA